MKYVSPFPALLILVISILISCGAATLPPSNDTEEDFDRSPAGAETETDSDGEPYPEIVLPNEGESLTVSRFSEVWGYVVAGSENALRPGLPISDAAYFGAGIDMYGSLTGAPDRGKLGNFAGRVHLVVADNSKPLTHFILIPGSEQRRALIGDILRASKGFDGLQINFENIPPRDGENFLSFLRELRAGLEPGQIFSVALYARTRRIAADVYDYARIAPLVDRVLVMGYDEHWSGSSPGPIASMGWSGRVAVHSLEVIGVEKLVMGIPFYGRAWASQNHSRAYVYSGIERIARENDVAEIGRENGIPTFRYDATITVTVYFEDAYSLSTRMEMYASMGVANVGFWRLGQETPAVWSFLGLAE